MPDVGSQIMTRPHRLQRMKIEMEDVVGSSYKNNVLAQDEDESPMSRVDPSDPSDKYGTGWRN